MRHEWPTTGGVDGESVTDAERRIPAFLAHRDRAVTASDFQALALATPGLALGRAEVVQGLMPGADPDSTRTGVPGVVSVFVFPNQPVALGNGPVATLAQLQDVFAYLRQRILIGTQLFVLSAEPVPLYASVSIRLLNNADSVATARGVQQALANYLWALPPGGPDGGGWPLGRTVAAGRTAHAGRARLWRPGRGLRHPLHAGRRGLDARPHGSSEALASARIAGRRRRDGWIEPAAASGCRRDFQPEPRSLRSERLLRPTCATSTAVHLFSSPIKATGRRL